MGLCLYMPDVAIRLYGPVNHAGVMLLLSERHCGSQLP